MGYEVILGKQVIGTVGLDNKVNYDMDKVSATIKEMVAGSSGGSFFTSAKVIYRWDRNRRANNEAVYNMWKSNPIIQNRVNQLNALTFGRGLKWIYDKSIQEIIDRFWRINRLRNKLNPLSTDSQLYGEVFIGLYPQATGDVLIGIYESTQVDIDFDPGNIYNVNKYYVTYKDEEKGTDERFEMMPIEKYLNEIEFSSPVGTGKKRGNMGLNGMARVAGKGVMVHIKFNNSTSEVYGTSDFKQIFDILPDYMNFVGDRLTIHQMYGSPAYDIEIDTDDPDVITNRINELAGFTIGSNPVHNASEKWKPLQFNSNGLSSAEDEKVLRGLICAGTGFPEYLLFNQNDNGSDNTFALTKIAEDRQDTFNEAIRDIHKFVVAVGGGDPSLVDDGGQIIFPEINTMSEKAKAEAYILKVGAKVCSRRTAALNMGHNWDIEEQQIIDEESIFGELMGNSDVAGAIGGRFTSRINNQDPNRDDGTDDRNARANASNITTQVIGDRKVNN